MLFPDWSEACYRPQAEFVGASHVAALAGYAIATGSGAALLGGKSGVAPARGSASDSPFAAMLAQLMGGASLPPGVAAQNSMSPVQQSFSASQGASMTAGVTGSLPGTVASFAHSLGEQEEEEYPSTAPAGATSNGAGGSATLPTALAQLTSGGTSANGPQSAAQQAASAWLQQMMSRGPSVSAGANPAVPASGSTLPSGIPNFAQQFAGAAGSTSTARVPVSAAQQAATSWLQQMTTASPTPSAPAAASSGAQSLPAGVASFLQTSAPAFAGTASVIGTAPMSPAQQAVAAWLQQATAGNSPANISVTHANTQSLPAGVASYAQLFGGSPQPSGASGGSQPAQSEASLLQQVIAASERVGASAAVAATNASTLPAGVASFTQSGNAIAPQGVAITTGTAANGHPDIPQPPQSIPAPRMELSPAQTMQNELSQLSSSQTTANPGQPSASPAAGNPATNGLQSVTGNFAVPAFPAAMAYAVPGSANAHPIAPPTTTRAAPTTAAQPQQAATQNQTVAQSASPVTDKAATLAQAAQNSMRQQHAAPVTEAQTLPVNMDLADTKDSARQESSGTAAKDESPVQPETANAAIPSTPGSLPQAATVLQHLAGSAPSASALPATAAEISSVPASTGVGAQAAASPAPESVPLPAPATPATASLATPDLNALAMNIAAKSLDGAKQFDIRLDPAELGRVDVRLSLDGNGNAQAHLAAERPETLALLQNNSATLSRALQDSGVRVADNALQFSLKGQEHSADGQQRAPMRARTNAIPDITAVGAMNSASANYAMSPSGSGVNIIV
jgi:flagellar hook-length control protein FliK